MAQVYDKTLFDSFYSVRAWEHGVRNQPRIPRHHYNWFVQTQGQFARLKRNVAALTGGPGWAQLTDIAIIGGGFGWTAELLLEADPTLNIINVETSPHCVNQLATSEEADLRQYLIDDGLDPDNVDYLVDPNDYSRTLTNAEAWAYWLRSDGQRGSTTLLDNDLSTNGQRRDVKQALGNNIDALVTEIALDALSTEAEIDNFLDNVEQTRPNPACTVVHLTEYTPDSLGYISKPLADWRAYLDARGFNHVVADTSGNYL
jgi:hypothetical protein